MLTNNRKQNILVKLASKAEAAKQTASGVWSALKGAVSGAGASASKASQKYMDIVKGKGTAASKQLLQQAQGMKSVDPKALAQIQGYRRAELAKRTAAIGAPAALVAGGVYGMGKGSGKRKARKKLGLTKSEYKSLTKSLKKADA